MNTETIVWAARNILFFILSCACVVAFFAFMYWLDYFTDHIGKRPDWAVLSDLDNHCDIGGGGSAQFDREKNALTTNRARNPAMITDDFWMVDNKLTFRRNGKTYSGFVFSWGGVEFKRVA